MDKREQVIKGLECCGYSHFMDKCQECPYDGKDCFKRLKTDALALLKEQEPRAMTLEEVKSLRPDDDVYIERISSITGVHYIYATTVWRVVSKSIKLCPDNATLWFSEYGETWRCWTSRPTEAEREAVKWDD